MSALPEVYLPHDPPHSTVSPQGVASVPPHVPPPWPSSAPKPENDQFYTQPQLIASVYNANPSQEKRVCGCSLVTLILLIVIGWLGLSAAGVAAGLAIFHHKYMTANSDLHAAEFATSLYNVTNGCSEASGDSKANPGHYKSQFPPKPTYNVYCNLDTKAPIVYVHFARTFNNCMEACTLWTLLYPNRTCGAVTFVPAWSGIAEAVTRAGEEGLKWAGDCWMRGVLVLYCKNESVGISALCRNGPVMCVARNFIQVTHIYALDYYTSRLFNTFDRVLWVPLQYLKKLLEGGYNLGGLLFHEYLSQNDDGSNLGFGYEPIQKHPQKKKY